QNYSYDAAGNLLQMRHEGAHNFTATCTLPRTAIAACA
ncbi:hypothetical protein PSYPI_48410, partial [Pseudomonas syringae pv. pisi str. 1704B]